MTVEPNPIVVTFNEDRFKAFGWDKFVSLYDALHELDYTDEIELDTETSGLGSFRQETLHSIQLGVDNKQFILDIPSIAEHVPAYGKLLHKLLSRKRCLLHNSLFDLPYFYKEGIVPGHLYDTLAAENCLTRDLFMPPGSRGYGALVKKYCNTNIDKALQKTINQGINSVEDIMYSATDVMHLRTIRDGQSEMAKRMQVEKDIELDNHFCKVLAYIEYSGIMVDKDKLMSWVREVEHDEWVSLQGLKKYGDINWASPQQVSEVLREHGIEEHDPKTGNVSTADWVLNKHPDKAIARDLQAYRGHAKQVSTYGRVWQVGS